MGYGQVGWEVSKNTFYEMAILQYGFGNHHTTANPKNTKLKYNPKNPIFESQGEKRRKESRRTPPHFDQTQEYDDVCMLYSPQCEDERVGNVGDHLPGTNRGEVRHMCIYTYTPHIHYVSV